MLSDTIESGWLKATKYLVRQGVVLDFDDKGMILSGVRSGNIIMVNQSWLQI
jgi:hypothetical protein